jgi:hypothetical protein
MATLFFDGFDRATFTKQLDPKYWSTEYTKPGYPRYAFGGYTYSNETIASNGILSATYSTYSVNNGIVPSGHHYSTICSDYNCNSYILSNDYPGFGSPPGFLALTNVPVNDPNNLEFISYIQLSGFPSISGTKSYFGIRTLGIETKHLDYHNVAFPAGRFGNKHPFLAFCSGNITGLLLNIVQISGDHLLPLKMYNPPQNTGVRQSIGLQVEQNNGISGVFDLNLSDTLPNYRITPLYSAQDTNGIPSLNNPCKILTIANDDTVRSAGKGITRGSDVTSRWTHFEFEFDHMGGGLKLKVEGTDALVENTDIYTDRDLWDIEIKISGFKYDNIRLFNRTYQQNTHYYDEGTLLYYYLSSYPRPRNPVDSAYYARGQLILFDDITLVDNTGNDPRYFLGADSKILPLTPGLTIVSNNYTQQALNNNEVISDGFTQWSKNTSSSDRRLLASIDKDSSYIFADKKGAINTIIYGANSRGRDDYGNTLSFSDPLSRWRHSPGEAVAGLKVYNSARKNFLDSSFINVVETGISDPHRNNVMLLIHGEEDPIRDYSRYNHPIIKDGSTYYTPNHRFDSSGIAFLSDNQKQSSLIANIQKHPEEEKFTIESWVNFTGQNDTIVLMDTFPRTLPNIIPAFNYNGFSQWYRISCNPSSIKIEHPIKINPNENGSNDWEISSITSQLVLPFPVIANTGEWHHVALVRHNPFPNTGQYIAYLNGVSGTTYQRLSFPSGHQRGGWQFLDDEDNSILEHNGNHPIWYPSKLKSSNIIDGPVLYSLTTSSYPRISIDSSGLPFLHNILLGGNGIWYGSYWLNKDPYPYIFIGYSGIIDEYRYSQNIARYTSNFDPPTSKFKANYDDYMKFGPIHITDRASYRLFQFYQMTNPGTNQPWTSGEIFTSGIRLGVEKL